MVEKVGPKDLDVTLKFGGGLNTRATEDEINPREAAGGQNFQIDLKNKEFKNRKPFDLIGTVPNGLEIRGGGSLLKADGTVKTCFQAGGQMYDWDGGTTFTANGTVGATAKMRGHWRTHNFTLDDKLILTDLNLVEVVNEWNGSTDVTDTSFTNEAGSGFGNFFARYCAVSDERALFGNVKDAGSTTPHLMVGSQRNNFTVITTSQRVAASGISAEDPFFLPSPDLRPINGLEQAFGTTVFSTEQGRLFNFTGNDATDYKIDTFFPRSAASGQESIAYIGNDIIYGRQGRIESVRDTDRFGDSEADDLTALISPTVEDYTGWQAIYNSRLNRVYLFPTGQSEVWVFQTAMRDEGQMSPWMRWKTLHGLAFQPTFAMSMLDPSDNLEYVFMGDASGNVYRLEGTGTAGDGGTSLIETEWTSALFAAPINAEVYNIEGYVKYRVPDTAFTVEITVLYAGIRAFNYTMDIAVPAGSGASYFGGTAYFGGEFYFGSVSGRFHRVPFWAAGQSNEMQIKVKVMSVSDFNISEIGLRFRAASSG